MTLGIEVWRVSGGRKRREGGGKGAEGGRGRGQGGKCLYECGNFVVSVVNCC